MRLIKRKLGVFNHFRYYKKYSSVKEKIESAKNDSLPINDLEIWKKKLLQAGKYNQTFLSVAEGFFSTKMTLVKKSLDKPKDVILICVVKDDLQRITKFIEYYRNLGIKHFAVLDDRSSDGTKEFLLAQNDIDVFESSDTYTTNMRQSWINRIIAYYGMNRWYLTLDSDEFLTTRYPSIQDMINTIGTTIHYRCLMVDMYPLDDKNDDFLNDFVGFDTNTYEFNKRNVWFNCYAGGMRKRVFSNEKNPINPYLIKTPVFFANKNFVQLNSHYNFPFSFDNDFVGIIRHYKFLKSDFAKFQERAQKKTFVNGSGEYIAYMDKLSSETVSFVNEDTAKFENYESFYKINIYKKNSFN